MTSTCGDNQAVTCLIITINDTSIKDLPLIITISDTCKNQPKRIDSDNTINLSSLIVSLVVVPQIRVDTCSGHHSPDCHVFHALSVVTYTRKCYGIALF